MKMYLSIAFIAFAFSSTSDAGRYWPADKLIHWNLVLNNGVAYIESPQFASHCNHNRGQINMSGTEFDKAQYAYALSAKAKGKSLHYVVDNSETTCIISGLKEVD